VAQRQCLIHLAQQALRMQCKARLGRELGHQVMVVGVEPLGHLQGGLACAVGGRAAAWGVVGVPCLHAMLGGHATRQGEVARQLGLLAAEAKARRLAAQQLDVAGHMVVQGEITHSHPSQSGLCLPRPLLAAQLTRHNFELVGVQLAAPVGLQCEFEFSLGAHARHA